MRKQPLHCEEKKFSAKTYRIFRSKYKSKSGLIIKVTNQNTVIMAIIKNESLGNIGYFSDKKGTLTNFIFEILDVEYRDNLYGYFRIKITNDNSKFVVINNLSICGPFSEAFPARLLEEGFYLCHPNLNHEIVLEIFSFEFDLYKSKLVKIA